MRALLDSIDWKSFVYGVIAAFVFGFVSQQLRVRLKKMGDYFKPQRITLFTKETPAQVGRGCSCGAVQIGLFVIVIVVVVVIAVRNGLI